MARRGGKKEPTARKFVGLEGRKEEKAGTLPWGRALPRKPSRAGNRLLPGLWNPGIWTTKAQMSPEP